MMLKNSNFKTCLLSSNRSPISSSLTFFEGGSLSYSTCVFILLGRMFMSDILAEGACTRILMILSQSSFIVSFLAIFASFVPIDIITFSVFSGILTSPLANFLFMSLAVSPLTAFIFAWKFLPRKIPFCQCNACESPMITTFFSFSFRSFLVMIGEKASPCPSTSIPAISVFKQLC